MYNDVTGNNNVFHPRAKRPSVKNMAASSLGEEEFLFPNEAHVLPWDRFRRWITCFCVVTFDIEVGQAMEVSCVKISGVFVLGTRGMVK